MLNSLGQAYALWMLGVLWSPEVHLAPFRTLMQREFQKIKLKKRWLSHSIMLNKLAIILNFLQ